MLADQLALILISLACQVHPRCLAFLISDITGESHLICFSVTCPCSVIKKPSYWSLKVAYLFVPPRNCPRQLNHPGWTLLMIDKRMACCSLSTASCTSHTKYTALGTACIFAF